MSAYKRSASSAFNETDNEPGRFMSDLAKTLRFQGNPIADRDAMGDRDFERACKNTAKAHLDKFSLRPIFNARGYT